MERTRALSAALALVVAACGAEAPPRPAPRPSPEPTSAPGGTGDAAVLEALGRAARAGAVTETLHGHRVEDPYRSLETDSNGTRAWVDAQTERTTRALGPRQTAELRARLSTLLAIGMLGEPTLAGDRLFFTRREGEEEQPILYVQDPGAAPRRLVDPTTYGERAALDYFVPTESGRHLAFGISQDGDERSVLRVMDVASGALLPDEIDHAKWSSVAWLNDDSGFYYTRYPRPDEPGFDRASPDTYFPRVFFHALGSNVAADPKVFEREDGSDVFGLSMGEDDRYLVINVFRSWSASDVYVFDRGPARSRRIAPSGPSDLWAVREGRDSIAIGDVHRGKLYLLTNEGAPRSKILATSPRPPRGGREAAFTLVVPEGPGTIEGWALSGDSLLVHTVEDVQSRLRLVDLRTRAARDVPLPTQGEVESVTASEDGGSFAFAFSGYVYPPAIFRLGARDGQAREVDRVRTDLDLASLRTERASVPSADGTAIPVTLIARGTIERDGSRPVILSGYGGFNLSLLPGFQRNILYWLERGGVYAVANLRGGGELGEEWHRAGMLENKERVFEDFEAVIRWLSASGVSQPSRIGITGGSNGGLLVGALLARAPETFGAAAGYVGLYDMVRYHRFPPAELWVPEYGTADDPSQLETLLRYSPYHRLAARAYPPTLIETADHDTRVHFGHSAKFAARLQELQRGESPIYFFMERRIGHGAGTRKSDLVERYVRMYAFFGAALGLAGD